MPAACHLFPPVLLHTQLGLLPRHAACHMPSATHVPTSIQTQVCCGDHQDCHRDAGGAV